ncbi:DUF1501 domain-containing protein [Pararcticibacter amylolyticus]|uniref:Twin-arginine translocation pathway signal n=1 Tax=Pararcticibacter amylolyticus TaxID=2173175 RepID=A0A2U2PJE6_9SPHI|nr:DUF1501 domain-containing protein [Pararcticibacter amylolyticus]PWG81523.1 hypothetical protein DDR33_06745 [Pararcticibacter amylolyticus]
MKRRSFLKHTGLAAGSLAVPAILYQMLSDKEKARGQKRLVMIYLQGGNDGWNTLVPCNNELYYRSRPSLALQRSELIPLNDHYGLNPALKELALLHAKGRVLFLNKLGHSLQESSHYEAFRIWHRSDNENGDTWLAPGNSQHEDKFPVRVFNGDQGKHLASSSPFIPDYTACTSGDFSEGLSRISEAIRSGSDANVFHISLDGFDTHQFQSQRQGALLSTYSSAVSAFVSDIEAIGQMDNTVILTYSEFGRSLKENSRRGTDHGNVGCAWLIGSRLNVKGILHPSAGTDDEARINAAGLPEQIFRSWCFDDPGQCQFLTNRNIFI